MTPAGGRARAARILREPLLWFLLAGGVLFGVYRWMNPEAFNRPDRNRIVLTRDDLTQMSVQWRAQGLPPLSAAQWKSLIDARVREEVLFREAVALGLDRDDTIVKRRMVQKMDFLAQDLAAARTPTSNELREWFTAHPERFTLPPRVSFRHLYFSFDKRGPNARAAASSALDALNRNPAAAGKAGDPFMFQDSYADRTPDQIAKEFGPSFAHAVFKLGAGQGWQGPVESGYGWHAVQVTETTPARLPPFEEVEPEVRTDWMGEQVEKAKQRVYEGMRARYDVVLPDLPTDKAAP